MQMFLMDDPEFPRKRNDVSLCDPRECSAFAVEELTRDQQLWLEVGRTDELPTGVQCAKTISTDGINRSITAGFS